MQPTGNNSISLTFIERSIALNDRVTFGSGERLQFAAGSSPSYYTGPQLVSMDVYPELRLTLTTFTPEPYVAKAPIPVAIVQQGEEFLASHWESNLHATGDTEFEAMENLKSTMLDVFESLSAEREDALAVKARNQLSVLRELIERKP